MLRFDYRLIALATSKRFSQCADVLVDGCILDDHIAPNSGDDLISFEKPSAFLAGVLEHVFENLFRSGGQFNLLAVRAVQVALFEVELERAEEVSFGRSPLHEAKRIV